MASILQPHTSPHPSSLPSPHHTASLCTTSHLHWAHPQCHIGHAHSPNQNSPQNNPCAIVNSTCSSNIKHGVTTLTTRASNNDHSTTESHTDTKVDSCSSLACANIHKDGRDRDGSTNTSDSGTSLHAPNVNYMVAFTDLYILLQTMRKELVLSIHSFINKLFHFYVLLSQCGFKQCPYVERVGPFDKHYSFFH